jgi:hypothetical protein
VENLPPIFRGQGCLEWSEEKIICECENNSYVSKVNEKVCLNEWRFLFERGKVNALRGKIKKVFDINHK